LIVAPLEEPLAVQGYGGHQHPVMDEGGRRRRQPPRQRFCQQVPIVLEREDHVAPLAGIEKHRPPTRPRPRGSGAVIAERGGLFLLPRQGQAAAIAGQTTDEIRLAPAGGAEPALIHHEFRAAGTARRKDRIQRVLRDLAKRGPKHHRVSGIRPSGNRLACCLIYAP